MTNRLMGWMLLNLVAACSGGGGGTVPGGGVGGSGGGSAGQGATASSFCSTICGMMADRCPDVDEPECISSCRKQHFVAAECSNADNALTACLESFGTVTCSPASVSSSDADCGSAEQNLQDCNSGGGGSGTGGGSSGGG